MPLWLLSATVMALGAIFDWRFIPAVIGFPVCMMATLGFFWMLASPRRPRGRATGRQANTRRYGRGVPRRLTAGDIAAMRQSLGMSSQLPSEQVRWLLAEAERLVSERAELGVRELAGPWREVRVALNRLHHLAGGS